MKTLPPAEILDAATEQNHFLEFVLIIGAIFGVCAIAWILIEAHCKLTQKKKTTEQNKDPETANK